MVLLLKQDKSLIISQSSRIYQKENIVNNLTIYCPISVDEIEDLSIFNAILYYTTATNDAYVEMLDQQESDKDGYLMYRLPINTKFTNSAGTNTISMAFTRDDNDDEIVLHSSECSVVVNRWDNAFKYVSSDGLAAIVNRIHELEEKAPDDLMLKEDVLHLAKKNEETGELEPLSEGVEILVPGDEDHEDESHDGVIDLDSLKNSSIVSSASGYQFMEL